MQYLKQLRSRTLVFLTHSMALPVLKLIRKKKPFPYTAAELWQLPQGTVGKDLVQMLDTAQLNLLPYYEKHDIKHVLLGYPTTEEGEVCLQCFMLGNGHISIPVIATVLFGVFTMPEHYTSFLKAFKKGRRSTAIKQWNWFQLIPCNTAHLQHIIFSSP
jgi:ubiquinone biosynthesis protein Coq4